MFTTPGLKIPITSRRFHFSSRFKPQDFCLLCSRDAGKSDLMHDWSDGNRPVIGLVTYSGLFMFVCIIFLSNNTQIKLYSYNNALNIEDRQKLLTNWLRIPTLPRKQLRSLALPGLLRSSNFPYVRLVFTPVSCVQRSVQRGNVHAWNPHKKHIYIYIYKSTVGKGKQ